MGEGRAAIDLASRHHLDLVIQDLRLPDMDGTALVDRLRELQGVIACTLANVTHGRYVMLAVNDTGCGMNAAMQARIFEPFLTTKPCLTPRTAGWPSWTTPIDMRTLLAVLGRIS